MMGDLQATFQHADIMLRGLALTFGLSVLAIGIALVLGALMLWAKKLPGATWLVRGFVETMRALPFVMVLLLVHFGTQKFLFRAPATATGCTALAIYGAAYLCEAMRAALASVPKGQWEAAQALGLRPRIVLRRVIIPQVTAVFVPLARVVAIMLLKESAVLSLITVPELTHAALRVQAETFRTVPVFVLLTACYWLLAVLVSRAILAFEPKLITSGRSARKTDTEAEPTSSRIRLRGV